MWCEVGTDRCEKTLVSSSAMSTLVRAMPLAKHLEKDNRGSGGGVQRRDAAGPRNADDLVKSVAHQPPQASTLAPDDEGQRLTCEGEVPHDAGPVGVEANEPHAEPAQVLERRGDAGDHGT